MKRIPMMLGPWYQENVAAAQTDVAIDLNGNASRNSMPMIRNGSVLGIAVHSNAPCTAGLLTVEATINGAGTGLTVSLDPAVHTTDNQATENKLLDNFIPGGLIGCRITTNAGWLPITADITVDILVEQ